MEYVGKHERCGAEIAQFDAEYKPRHMSAESIIAEIESFFAELELSTEELATAAESLAENVRMIAEIGRKIRLRKVPIADFRIAEVLKHENRARA